DEQIKAVKLALHLSTAPSSVVCREEEQNVVLEFCKGKNWDTRPAAAHAIGSIGIQKMHTHLIPDKTPRSIFVYFRGLFYDVGNDPEGGYYARLVEAVIFGCIPIIIADDIVLPFADAIPWEDIGVFVAEEEPAQPGDAFHQVLNGLAKKLPHDNSVFLKPGEKILNWTAGLWLTLNLESEQGSNLNEMETTDSVTVMILDVLPLMILYVAGLKDILKPDFLWDNVFEPFPIEFFVISSYNFVCCSWRLLKDFVTLTLQNMLIVRKQSQMFSWEDVHPVSFSAAKLMSSKGIRSSILVCLQCITSSSEDYSG
ncbi:hypothetical protein V8G54_013010, partial [Vigna mungo]